MQSIASKVLSWSPAVIVLFSFLYSVSLSNTDTTIINMVGAIGTFLWLISICHRCSTLLSNKNIEFGEMKSYKITAIILALSYLAISSLDYIDPEKLLSQRDIENGTTFMFNRILYGSLAVLLGSLLLTYRNAVKLLSSAEKGKEQNISEYYKTLILTFIIPWIGYWYIQDRARIINKTASNKG